MEDEAINEKYESREQRVVIETNREYLPSFVESLRRPGHLDTRPFYQRRARWSAKQQSLLIESFIMNVPVPPIFLYEDQFSRFEVMDGQQRIDAIRKFYSDELTLVDLDRWKELNGKRYSTLPSKVRAGIDRRSISSVIVLAESAKDEEEKLLLKQLVFKRLNTGGVKLSRQEVRNCVFAGGLNNLLVELAQLPVFSQAWGISPPVADGDDDDEQEPEATLYRKMVDVELVLRFFALRHAERRVASLQDLLDDYMAYSRGFVPDDLAFLRRLFAEALELARGVFGDQLFRPFNPEKNQWETKPFKDFYDSVMIGFAHHRGQAAELLSRREEVIERTRALCIHDSAGLLRGKSKTQSDLRKRVGMFSETLSQMLDGD